MLPSASSLCTGAQFDPAQVSKRNGFSPGGASGFLPQRSTTQSERPSRSTATPLSAPQSLCDAGSFPQGAMVRYGLGRSLVGMPSQTGTIAHAKSRAPDSAAIIGVRMALELPVVGGFAL